MLTSSLGASCSTTGVSSENRVWMAFATLSRLKGTAWKTKSDFWVKQGPLIFTKKEEERVCTFPK